MAFDEGFNFRQTLGFPNDPDPADTQFVTHTTAYDTTAGGVTFGWTTTGAALGSRNRVANIDTRLAGICFVSHPGGVDFDFQVDLPATGDYDIYLAMGDAGNAQTDSQVRIFDDADLKATIGPNNISAGQFYDATDTLHTTAANWVANNTKITATFASTTLLLRVGNTAAASSASVISHLRVVQVAVASADTPRMTLLGVG